MQEKIHFFKIALTVTFFTGILLSILPAFPQVQELEVLIALAKSKVDTNHTIPSFTELRRQLKYADVIPAPNDAYAKLQTAINNLKDKRMPYNIVMNFHGDPKTQLGFNWYGNANITGGKVEIVQGKVTNHNTFNSLPKITINASTAPLVDLNYNVSANNLHVIANIGINTPKSYTSNKAVATNLTPGTTYSFRVGGIDNHWSEIGTFTTDKDNKEAFSFMYATDPQAVNYAMFDIAQMTTHAAFTRFSNINFWIKCGDMVETPAYNTTEKNSEWEWEQFFESQQDILLKTPFAPVLGNHDNSVHHNFKHHFNMGIIPHDTTGSTYTYIYGDAQFFAINTERYNHSNNFNAFLRKWVRDEIELHPDITWRLVYFHRPLFTGANHQNGEKDTAWRKNMIPLIDSLNIDIVFQGHDHVYEVIGPVKNRDTVPGAVSHVLQVTQHDTLNVTGKSGGIFNVTEGTLYFLNGASGTKKYYPRPLDSMPDYASSSVPDYPSLFTGRFGQPGNPTYSKVTVTSENITITTYEVLPDGSDRWLDEITVVKYCEPNTQGFVTYSNNQSFTNTTLTIGNTLRITNNATVTFTNSTLRFYSTAKIIIDPGSKLVLDGTTLTNSCSDKLWQGIFVSGNTYLPQTPQDQGVLELKNGAIIENAWNAITTHGLQPNGNIDWNTRGGIIYANNAIFKNNRRSVEFLAYPPIGSNIVRQNASYFRNCTFMVDDNHLFETSSSYYPVHITMWGVSGVQVRGCKFENNIINMPNRGQAIYTIDAGYIVDEYCSSYNMQTCKCNNLPAPSDFRGFNRAIESLYLGMQYTIRIDRSNFANNIAGIDFRGKNSFQLSRLKMDINTGYSNYPIGIYLDYCTGYKVEGNEIRRGIFHVGMPTGIRVNRAGTDENRIYKNDISNTYYGIRVTEELSNPPPPRAFPLTGLQFVCNDLYENNHDISIQHSGIVRASQGSAISGANNLFSQNGNYDIFNGSANVMDYYCRRGTRATPIYITNNVNIHSATGNPCEHTFPCNYQIDSSHAKSSELPLVAYQELNNKYTEMLNHFYDKGYDKILNDYYNGIIENKELLKEAMVYHEEILTITKYMAELSHEALFTLKTDKVIDFTQIRDWYDEIYTLSAKYSLAETYYQLEKFEEGLKTLDLIPRMFNLNKDEMIEHDNYVSLFKFKNEVRESGRTIAELKEEEIEKMIHFAKASHGLSSLMARGVLCFFYEICFEDAAADNATAVQSPPNDGIKSPSNFEGVSGEAGWGSLYENITIHPNPTTGELQVTSNGLQVTSIEVFDVYGGKQKAESKKQAVLNISHLQPGVYFVKITTTAGEVIKKIVKQ